MRRIVKQLSHAGLAKRVGLVWIVGGLLSGSVAAERMAPRELRDLYYGEVLFHFYQDQHFTAATHLLAALAQNRLPNHQHDATLLLGGLYLSYGQHQQAQQIFEAMLDEDTPPAVRNRAWYYLAKLLYQRGLVDRSLTALNQIDGELATELQGDRQLLTANLQYLKGDDAAAEQALTRWRGKSDDAFYARYNRGIAQLRQDKTSDNDLELLAAAKARGNTEWTIKDRANLALGFAALEQKQPELAKSHFQRVRLQGPYSNRAMLGLGWADAELNNHERALVAWTELSERNVLDPSVQEALLAVPHALGQLTANRQALDAYERAVATLTDEAARLTQSIQSMDAHNFLPALLDNNTGNQSQGWLWQLKSVDDSPESRYLAAIFASHEFQESLKNYRDLLFLRDNVQFWVAELPIYRHMLALRRQRYQQCLPSIDGLKSADVGALAGQAEQLSAQLTQVRSSEDFSALMTPSELDQLARLTEVGDRLRALPNTPQTAALADKQRVLDGFLRWQVMAQGSDRLWQSQKQLNALHDAVDAAKQQQNALHNVLTEAPQRFEGFDQRIQALNARIPQLQQRLDRTIVEQQRYLQRLAVAALQQHQARIERQIVEAQFGIAALYDQARESQSQRDTQGGDAQ